MRINQLSLPLIVTLLLLVGCSAKDPVHANVTGHAVKVTWKPVNNASAYYIYRSRDGINFNQIATVVGGTSSYYIDKVVIAGDIYFYKAKTFCNVCTPNTSQYSNTVHVRVP